MTTFLLDYLTTLSLPSFQMVTAETHSIHKPTKTERIRVQVTLSAELYELAKEYAKDHGMFPGGVIDVSLDRFLDDQHKGVPQ